jgi:LysM repeat protein
MKSLPKILRVCVIVCVLIVAAVVVLHGVALVGVFVYSRMKDNTSQTAIAVATPAGATHVVKRGETLSAIATRVQSTVEELAKLNGLQNTNHIVEGQTLKLPSKG